MTRLIRGPLGALFAILVVLGALWPTDRVQPLSTFDQPFYLGIAHDLRHAGRFTDGYMFADPGSDGTRGSGMRFAPLYPALLAAVAWVDPALRRGMDCQVRSHGHDPACPAAAPAMRWLQFAMLAATFTLFWCMAVLVTGRRRVAWLALVLALPTADVLLRSVDTLMTEITALLLTTACLAAVLAAWRRHSLPWLAAGGLLLGLAILTRPAFLYLLYATIPAGLLLAACAGRSSRAARPSAGSPNAVTPEFGAATAVMAGPGGAGASNRSLHPLTARRVPLAGPRPGRRALAALAVFVLCAAGVVAPWIMRNALVVGRASLTHGYDSHTLVQRISFDSMTWREYGLSYLCWLPDGAGLGHTLLGPHACDRFGWDERPDTFYSLGMGPLMQATLTAAGGWDHHLDYLLAHYILREPLWHAAVTIPLALRAMWIDHYWGLLLGPCSVLLTLHALRGTWRRARAVPRRRAMPRPGTLRLDTPRVGAVQPGASGPGTSPIDASRFETSRSDAPDASRHASRPPRERSAAVDALWPGDGTWQPCYLLLVVPAWFMLGFNAAVAVNQTRYNLMLIPGFALAGALLLDPALRILLDRARSHHWKRWNDRLAHIAARLRLPSWSRLLPQGRLLSSAVPEDPPPPAGPWRHPPLAARASGSARSNAARRRRGPRAG
jgi:hypothetical protein